MKIAEALRQLSLRPKSFRLKECPAQTARTALRMPSTAWPRSMPRQASRRARRDRKLGADIPEEELREAVEKLIQLLY